MITMERLIEALEAYLSWEQQATGQVPPEGTVHVVQLAINALKETEQPRVIRVFVNEHRRKRWKEQWGVRPNETLMKPGEPVMGVAADVIIIDDIGDRDRAELDEREKEIQEGWIQELRARLTPTGAIFRTMPFTDS